MLVHEHALVKVRRDMPLDLAALIGCGVITGYGAVVHTAKVEPGSTRGGGRLRRHRAVDHQRGADCRRRPHHRDRQGPVQARTWPRPSAPPTSSTPADGDTVKQVMRPDQRRRALLVRVHRPEADRRAGLRRAEDRRRGAQRDHVRRMSDPIETVDVLIVGAGISGVGGPGT
jgi:hypothetical protein